MPTDPTDNLVEHLAIVEHHIDALNDLIAQRQRLQAGTEALDRSLKALSDHRAALEEQLHAILEARAGRFQRRAPRLERDGRSPR
jgi:hypothetical protein